MFRERPLRVNGTPHRRERIPISAETTTIRCDRPTSASESGRSSSMWFHVNLDATAPTRPRTASSRVVGNQTNSVPGLLRLPRELARPDYVIVHRRGSCGLSPAPPRHARFRRQSGRRSVRPAPRECNIGHCAESAREHTRRRQACSPACWKQSGHIHDHLPASMRAISVSAIIARGGHVEAAFRSACLISVGPDRAARPRLCIANSRRAWIAHLLRLRALPRVNASTRQRLRALAAALRCRRRTGLFFAAK